MSSDPAVSQHDTGGIPDRIPAAIELLNVSKLYPIGRPALTDVLLNQVSRGHAALKGVNLVIHPGETIGILGGNGAGKSTLLQIMLGTLTPSEGQVTVNGRVAGLLELGAGFNPQWTGRRNSEFFSMIHGCSRKGLDKLIGEIERFADIGKAFDQPMRTYSSGMFIRVAFAAAIAVDPDIFIIDEALAVGDARFQKKCFDHFARMQARGKTIILVSHDTGLVARFCDRGLMLVDGHLAFDGPARDACERFLKTIYQDGEAISQSTAGEITTPEMPAKTGEVAQFCWPAPPPRLDKAPHFNPDGSVIGQTPGHIRDMALVNSDNQICGDTIAAGSRTKLLVQIKAARPITVPRFSFLITSSDNVQVTGTSNLMLAVANRPVAHGEEFVVSFEFDTLFTSGDYFIDIGLADACGALEVLEWHQAVCQFKISNPAEVFGVADARIRFDRQSPAILNQDRSPPS